MSQHYQDADTGLSKRTLGVPAIVFMIIAASAPLTVVAGGVTTSFAVTESLGVPLGYLVVAAVLTLFTVGYTAMGRHITNAGAFYAYISRGIGRPAGVGASLVALVAYNAMQVGLYGLFGFQLSLFVEAKTGAHLPWWVFVFACIIVVGILGTRRVDFSATVLGMLVALEFLCVIIFDAVSFVAAPEGVSTVPLQPGNLFGPAFGLVLVFGVAAFMGFEGAAIYGEEAKDPKRTVPRATYLAVLIIGIFYAFSSWAFTVGVGPAKIVDSSAELGPDLMFVFLGKQLGSVWADIATVLFITSLFAALLSFHNAVARYFFSLGREGVLPAWCAHTGTSGAPWAGSLVQTAIAVVSVGAFALAGDAFGGASAMLGEQAFLFPVLTMFNWLTNTGAAALVLLMGVIAFAVIGFFRRTPHSLGVFTTLVAPLVSGILLLVMFALILSNFTLMLGQAEPDASTFILPGLIFVALAVGIVWGLLLRAKNPRVYEQIGHGTVPGEFGTQTIEVVEE